MDTQDTLMMYSEWLDSQGLIVSDAAHLDPRSHSQLAADFIEHWEGSALAGNEPLLGLATTMALITELQVRANVSMIAGENWPHYRTVDHG